MRCRPRRCSRCNRWSNAVAEQTIGHALAHRARTVDLFFMIGLPHQGRDDALKIPEYCERLFQRFGDSHRLRVFVAPLGPFLDPGSRAFEDPALGYRLFSRSLSDHCEAYTRRDWQQGDRSPFSSGLSTPRRAGRGIGGRSRAHRGARRRPLRHSRLRPGIW
jgi:hypothetical protein